MSEKPDIINQLTRAWAVSTPLVAVNSFDPLATITMLSEQVFKDTVILRWDIGNGFMIPLDANDPRTEKSTQAYKTILGDQKPSKFQNLSDALSAALRLPPQSALFVINAYRYLDTKVQGSAAIAQCICNLRDEFKSNQRMLVLLNPEITLPPELAQDVMIVEEPLPDDAKLGSIVKELYEAAEDQGWKAPSKKELDVAVNAMKGMAAFPAEQSLAMSMYGTKPNQLDVAMLRERKLSVVEKVGGIVADRGTETFETVRGLTQIQKFFDLLFKGPKPPRDLYRIDEIEKLFGGLGADGGPADNTGVTQDILGVWLRAMEDYGWDGLLAVGVAGGGKSMISKTAGNTYGAQTYSLDTGALKKSLLGESEAAVRAMVKTMHGISGDRAFIIATCNDLRVLPAALRRRFRSGIWFFDLPTQEEQDQIWPLYLEKYGLDAKQPKPDYKGWTGAEIRNVCEKAWQLGCSLKEAAQFIVPVWLSDAVGVENLRDQADGRFLSTSAPGFYRIPKMGIALEAPGLKGRKLMLTGNN